MSFDQICERFNSGLSILSHCSIYPSLCLHHNVVTMVALQEVLKYRNMQALSLLPSKIILTVYGPAAAAKSLQSYPTLCDPIDGSPPWLPRPWDSPGKNTGVGCHFLLQCRKVKSESEVAQLCPTLSDPTDCSLPGSSIPGIFQARVLEWGAIAFSVYGPMKVYMNLA